MVMLLTVAQGRRCKTISVLWQPSAARALSSKRASASSIALAETAAQARATWGVLLPRGGGGPRGGLRRGKPSRAGRRPGGRRRRGKPERWGFGGRRRRSPSGRHGGDSGTAGVGGAPSAGASQGGESGAGATSGQGGAGQAGSEPGGAGGVTGGQAGMGQGGLGPPGNPKTCAGAPIVLRAAAGWMETVIIAKSRLS